MNNSCVIFDENKKKMIIYLFIGTIVLLYLLWEEIKREGSYEISIIDIFISWSIITLWPLALGLYIFKDKINLSKGFFKLGKK